MPHAPRKHLLPVEDTLAALDETVTALSKCAVDFSARVDDEDAGCLYQWHKLEKAARALMQARAIENESLAAVSVLSAEKELISRAVALMDCMRVTAGGKDPSAPNLRQPGRKTSKHPWGQARTEEGDSDGF